MFIFIYKGKLRIALFCGLPNFGLRNTSTRPDCVIWLLRLINLTSLQAGTTQAGDSQWPRRRRNSHDAKQRIFRRKTSVSFVIRLNNDSLMMSYQIVLKRSGFNNQSCEIFDFSLLTGSNLIITALIHFWSPEASCHPFSAQYKFKSSKTCWLLPFHSRRRANWAH
jgi:hypothetical protein